jgi:energy-coupling factor transporter ATP-binding protein EcfA2
MLRVRALSYRYPDSSAPALADVSLDAAGGECLCITGPSGSGKTTLLHAIKGLLHDGTTTGQVVIEEPGGGRERVQSVGLVFQSAESQILSSTVAEEVAFGPENLCVPAPQIAERVVEALDDVNLTGFWDRNVERLSAGQKHRVAIAAVLSMRPRVLLLDEPTSQLDAGGKAELVLVLGALKRSGYTVVVVEHNLTALADVVDRYVVMDAGRIEAVTTHVPPELVESQRLTARSGPAPRVDRAPAIVGLGVRCSYPGVGEVLSGVDVRVLQGERVHLFGRNGCGKSTLLACIAGVTRPDAGSVQVSGVDVARRGVELFGRVGYLFQNPQRQLFENTVHDEVAFSLKRLRLPAAAVGERVAEALDVCEVGHLASRLPLSLSFGEQHRVALASVIATRAPVLLLDEPFSGLDLGQRRRLLRILAHLGERHGTTILIASHDPLPDLGWPDRVLTLSDGVAT